LFLAPCTVDRRWAGQVFLFHSTLEGGFSSKKETFDVVPADLAEKHSYWGESLILRFFSTAGKYFAENQLFEKNSLCSASFDGLFFVCKIKFL
jgi:hypothetical protein